MSGSGRQEGKSYPAPPDFPVEELRPYIEGAKKVLIVEEDLTAQLREQFAIRFDCHDKLLSLLQYDGTPFLASTIINKSKEVI